MIRKKIVDDEEIMNNQQITDMIINEQYLDFALDNEHSSLCFLAKLEIISNFRLCPVANHGLSYCALRRCKRYVDGFKWVCPIKTCGKCFSVRQSSIMEGCKLPTRTIIKLIYKYVQGVAFVDAAYELGMSRQTSSKYAALVREVIGEHIAETSGRIGGFNDDGSEKIIEMDESMFFKRKYNRGRITNGTWYIGGIVRGSRECFMFPVSNRNTETITEIILDNVRPGTRIITDKWAAYKKALDTMTQYSHDRINHSLHFVDPERPEIHTQNIEGLWSRSKYFLRKRNGLHQEQHSEMLIQFLWEYRIEKRKRFNSLLSLLKYYY